jgi:hypothetical protein
MSLAITAAPFDSDNQNQNYNNYNSSDTPVNRKRQTMNTSHAKTQKRMPIINSDFNSEKVNSVLQSIHNSSDSELGDFNPKKNHGSTSSLERYNPSNLLNPLAPPISVKNQQINDTNDTNDTNQGEAKEGMTNQNIIPKPLDNDEMELQELQSAFLNDTQVRDYYKKLVPTYQNKNNQEQNDTNKAYYMQRNMNNNLLGYINGANNDLLLNKINYMINLLEDQKDERTNNVTEEVVLYSFLGIFIIFIADSFARVGKYTR